MSIPPTAFKLPRPLDPSDLEGYGCRIRRGDAPTDTLRSGEAIQSYSFAPTPEAVAAGLIIRDDPDRAPRLVGQDLTFWLCIDPSMRSSTLFNGGGLELAMELTFETNSSPSRTKQKTVTVQVSNQ